MFLTTLTTYTPLLSCLNPSLTSFPLPYAQDTKAGIMVTNTEVILIWTDPYLRWDPDYYNNTVYLRVLYSDVWHPDIILYNS